MCVFYFVEQGEPGEGESSVGSCGGSNRGSITEEKENPRFGGGGRRSSISGKTETGGSNRRRIDIVDALLKQQCITRIKNIITMTPVTVLTRDAVVNMPTSLLMEVYKQLDLNLEENDCGVIFLLHEVMMQRTFTPNNATLYQSACAACIQRCGSLSTKDISFHTRNMTEKCLNDMTKLFAREHWCSIISKILSEREVIFQNMEIED